MRKRDELTDPASCMSRARPDEMTFVLLARDEAAPVAIRAWVAERVRLGKNRPDDAQILEAQRCAWIMGAERISGGLPVAQVTTEGGIRLPSETDDEKVSIPPWQDRLTFNFDVSESSPVVKGTWVTVGHIVSLIVDGWTWADILRTHPELTEDDIRVCLAYTVESEPEPEASPT